MTLTRTTRGLDTGVYDDFGTDTSANYDPLLGTVSVATGLLTIATANDRVIHKTASTVKCVTASIKRSGARAAGPFYCASASLVSANDVDGYTLYAYGTPAWYFDRVTNNAMTNLGYSTANVPADGATGIGRIYLAADGAKCRCGVTALTDSIASTDTTYTAAAYCGFVAGNQNDQQADWLDARPSHLVTVTGLPSGWYAKVSDGTTTAKAAASEGTAAVDAGAVLFPLASVTLYNGDPDGAGVLQETLDTGTYADMGGGDVLAYTSGRSLMGICLRGVG